MVDLLFGTTGHTNELRLPTTYCLKEGAAETLRALLLRATACLCLVSNLPDRWGNLRAGSRASCGHSCAALLTSCTCTQGVSASLSLASMQ